MARFELAFIHPSYEHPAREPLQVFQMVVRSDNKKDNADR